MNGYFERGEIYWVRMDTGFGTETGVGRPGVILTNNETNSQNTVVTIAFLSRKYHPGQRFVEVMATGEKSYVICNQVQSYDKGRLGKLIGKLNAAEQKALDDAIEKVFDLGYVDDAELKAKDAEIEARDAVIVEKDSEIQSLRDRIKNLEAAHADEVAGLKIELTVYQKLYEKSLDYTVDMKFAADLAQRREPVAEEPPVVEELPVGEDEGKVDINSATLTALKKLGFTLPMAKKIQEGRPYSSVDDLKRVNGLKANMLKIVEPKLCCRPVVTVVEAEVVETPVVEEKSDLGFEPVDLNTASAKELIAVGFANGTAYKITSYRNRNGLFHSVDDLRYVQISQAMIDRFRDHLTVVVTETPEDDTERLNVNEATVEELVAIGFSEILANRIVLYREKNGRFGVIYDLLKVSGVNGKTLNSLNGKVRV